MSDISEKYDLHFYQLVISLHGAAMQQMGKIVSPITGKIERDLMQAKGSIDLLEMLKKKTEGNLTEEETKMLDHVLFELRMNYIEESKKPDSASADSSDEETDSNENAEPEKTEPTAEK